MTTFMSKLSAASGASIDTPFEPQARYYTSMDFILYLNEDVSYRADRVDSFLTVLWHPAEERLVGIKLKGFRFLFQQLKDILELKETEFLPLVKALKFALVAGLAEHIMDDVEKQRSLEARYEEAVLFADGISVPPEELRNAI